MRISRGRARFEARDPPASRLLKRSPHVGRHLRSEGSDVSVAELRNRDGKRKLCVHPPIFAVPSQRNAHHFQSSSLSEQADNGESRGWYGDFEKLKPRQTTYTTAQNMCLGHPKRPRSLPDSTLDP